MSAHRLDFDEFERRLLRAISDGLKGRGAEVRPEVRDELRQLLGYWPGGELAQALRWPPYICERCGGLFQDRYPDASVCRVCEVALVEGRAA